MSVADYDQISVLLIWTAVALYALAFLVYAFDLSRRAQFAVEAKDARELVGAAAAGASGAGALNPAPAGSSGAASADAPQSGKRNLWARIATSIVWLGFLSHLVADVMRGIAAGRVPWSNNYEFAMTGTLLIVAVFLGVLFRYDMRYLGTFIIGIVVVIMGIAALNFYIPIGPLSDPLKSYWLVIHVFVASLATAFYALACGLSMVQLLQGRRERKQAEARGAGVETKRSFLDTVPAADRLEGLAYRFSIIGFILWTFTLIAGAIWANDAWGRYWAFDTKEVWTFVIWVLYAGYIHARATKGWRGSRSAWMSIVGFVAVMFNFTIVNIFFKGLHAYSGVN